MANSENQPDTKPLKDSIILAIRDEVERRVEHRENIYWKFGGLFVALVILFFAVLWKVSVAEVRETVARQLAEQEVIKTKERISTIKMFAEDANLTISNIAASVDANSQFFFDRLRQIKQQDNIITKEDLSTLFVYQTVTNISDRKIILNYEPVFQTIEFRYKDANSLTPEYSKFEAFSLEGKILTITNGVASRSFHTLSTNEMNLKNYQIAIVYLRKFAP